MDASLFPSFLNLVMSSCSCERGNQIFSLLSSHWITLYLNHNNTTVYQSLQWVRLQLAASCRTYKRKKRVPKNICDVIRSKIPLGLLWKSVGFNNWNTWFGTIMQIGLSLVICLKMSELGEKICSLMSWTSQLAMRPEPLTGWKHLFLQELCIKHWTGDWVPLWPA